MHIAHLETGRQLYGGARQVLLLMRGLEPLGIRGTLVCAAGSAVADEATQLGLDVRKMPMRGDLDLAFVGRLTRLLPELAPDLLHVHSRRGADWMGGIAARHARIPALLTRRVDCPESPRIGRLKYRPYARVVAISNAIRQQIERSGVEAARLSVIRSAVDPERLAPAWSRERLAREFALDPRCLLVGCVAQLIPRKGHRELFVAWRDVLAECPNARLLVFGRGPLERQLRRSIAAGDFADSVILAGYRPDLAAFLGRLDLLVHPALEEGLGLAVLEAQAAGVPVVAFRAGGVPEAVADGRTGLLVPTGDAQALASALTGLLQNENRRGAFSEEARTWAAREFRVDDMVNAYLTLYRDLTETRAK